MFTNQTLKKMLEFRKMQSGEEANLRGIDKDITHDGKRIYWKNRPIDIVSTIEQDASTKRLDMLAGRCRKLEEIEVSVHIKTVVFYWEWFKDMDKNDKYKELLSRCPDIRVSKSKILFIFDKAAFESNGQWTFSRLPVWNSESWKKHWSLTGLKQRGYTGLPLLCSDLDGVQSCLEHYKIPSNLLDVMAKVLKIPT